MHSLPCVIANKKDHPDKVVKDSKMSGVFEVNKQKEIILVVFTSVLQRLCYVVAFSYFSFWAWNSLLKINWELKLKYN